MNELEEYANDLRFRLSDIEQRTDLYDRQRDDRDEARIGGGDEREDEARRRWET